MAVHDGDSCQHCAKQHQESEILAAGQIVIAQDIAKQSQSGTARAKSEIELFSC